MENYNRIKKDFLGTYYYLDDKFHRIDGPALDYNSGHKEWRQNGKLHRIDGPAIECANGYKEWYQNGLLHRINGPAVEHNEYKAWYYEDELIDCNSQEEFERLIKLKLFW